MRRHWRELAERAAKAAFSLDDVCEAISHALKKDARELPLNSVRDILDGGKQGSLFQNDRIKQLEAARETCRGSALGNSLIDCAIEAITDGLTGKTACRRALANAFAEYTRSNFRSIEEHYQREASSRSARHIRDRLNAARARCDLSALASALTAPAKPPRTAIRLPKRTGLDEGPPL